MTKCVNCILSYLVMFILENIKLIKDEMMSYLSGPVHNANTA